MAILLAIAGVCAFGVSLWGSVLGCITGDCCAPQPTVFTVWCLRCTTSTTLWFLADRTNGRAYAAVLRL